MVKKKRLFVNVWATAPSKWVIDDNAHRILKWIYTDFITPLLQIKYRNISISMNALQEQIEANFSDDLYRKYESLIVEYVQLVKPIISSIKFYRNRTFQTEEAKKNLLCLQKKMQNLL